MKTGANAFAPLEIRAVNAYIAGTQKRLSQLPLKHQISGEDYGEGERPPTCLAVPFGIA